MKAAEIPLVEGPDYYCAFNRCPPERKKCVFLWLKLEIDKFRA